jgi:hypothetical protein
MSVLLSTIDFVPPESNDSIPARPPISPHIPNHASTRSRDATDVQLFSENPIRVPLDLENGGLKDGRIFAVIAVLTGVQFLSSLSNGFLTVGLPRIASDLSLPEHLLLWPSGVY